MPPIRETLNYVAEILTNYTAGSPTRPQQAAPAAVFVVKAQTPMKIKVGKVVIDNGVMDFSDESIDLEDSLRQIMRNYVLQIFECDESEESIENKSIETSEVEYQASSPDEISLVKFTES